MKRVIIPLILVSLLLTGCATRPPKPEPLAFTVEVYGEQTILTLPIGRETLLQSGYREGDWLDLTFDGVVLRVLYAAEPKYNQPTLVASQQKSVIHLPTAIKAGEKGVLSIARPEQGGKTSLYLSGSFVFTF